MRATLDGSTALYKAAEAGRLPIVKQLVEHGANVNLPGQAASRRFRPAPTWAASQSSQFLMEKGADPKAIDDTQKAAIIYAAGKRLSRRRSLCCSITASTSTPDTATISPR